MSMDGTAVSRIATTIPTHAPRIISGLASHTSPLLLTAVLCGIISLHIEPLNIMPHYDQQLVRAGQINLNAHIIPAEPIVEAHGRGRELALLSRLVFFSLVCKHARSHRARGVQAAKVRCDVGRVSPSDASAAVVVLPVLYHLVCAQETGRHRLDADVVAQVSRAEAAKQLYRRVRSMRPIQHHSRVAAVRSLSTSPGVASGHR